MDTYKIESDARVDFCHMPTYLATAIIMKAFLADRDLLERREESILAPALERCCARELSGHGYEDLSGQIEAMRVFLRAGVQAFVHRYPKLCPKFTLMIYSIVDTYRRYIEEERFVFDWGENHETDFREIVGFFPEGYLIFVYGTLMKGQRYHGRYLSPLEPLGVGVLSGYRMFDIGSFPGIVPGKGKVKGEIYRVNARQLAAIDHLEDEGDLYVRTTVKVRTAPLCCVDAYTYVYNQALNGKEEIPIDKQPYSESPLVWYVAYGSNLLEERLMYYIAGDGARRTTKNILPAGIPRRPGGPGPWSYPTLCTTATTAWVHGKTARCVSLTIRRPARPTAGHTSLQRSNSRRSKKRKGRLQNGMGSSYPSSQSKASRPIRSPARRPGDARASNAFLVTTERSSGKG